MPPKTQRERDAEKRVEKLEMIDEQVKQGSLSIRQMTAKEKAKYAKPPVDKNAPAPRARRKRSG